MQAILQSFSVDLCDASLINDLASAQEAFIINLCCDRASPNMLLAKTLLKMLSSPAVDPSILGHLEPCGAHGVALVKARAVMSKDIISSCSSFTCLTKHWRFMEELRSTTIRIVENNLKVKRERRPAGRVEGCRDMVAALFGIESVESLSRENKTGHLNRWLQELEELCSGFKVFAKSGVEDLEHSCWVEEGGPEFAAGLPEGAPCCGSFDESVERAAAPFLNVMVNTSWGNSCASGWTYIISTLRRLVLGNACNRLLPSALVELQVLWNATDSLQATLERMVAADSGDFHSRSKLRLLRVVRGLSGPQCGWMAATALVTLLVVDEILFEILGDGKLGSRARLYDLVGWDTSLVAKASQGLLRLLESWRPGSESWQLVEMSGADISDGPTRLWARAQTLQLCAGLVDAFELRMSRPPYSLLKVTDAAVPLDEKIASIEEAPAMPFTLSAMVS